MRLYLDACAIIYLIEGETSLRERVDSWIRRTEGGGGTIATSQLSRLECRVKPLKTGNKGVLDTYDQFFSQPSLFVADITAGVVDRATSIRAENGVKTPDAIHLATAIENAADVFLTGDARLAVFTQLTVEVL